MPKPTVIHWFRHDLRLADNPALTHASKVGEVWPIVILDTTTPEEQALGAASKLWLHHALHDLDEQLDGHLTYVAGDPKTLLPDLCKHHGITTVTWNRCYEPWSMERDRDLKTTLRAQGVDVQSFNGSLLWEPWTITKNDGDPYQVFTPFYRKGCLKAEPPRQPLPAPELTTRTLDTEAACSLEALNLLPDLPWGAQVMQHWDVGATGANERLSTFLDEGLPGYKRGRNCPAQPHVSRLSPYLRWGLLSPNTVFHAARSEGDSNDVDHFCSELGWREFSYQLLFHHPNLPTENLHRKFDDFPWVDDDEVLQRWQHGQTGIPFVDAGMRELWQTGYLHNRVRMVVASFLVKNLRLHWRHGAAWFWDCLVDADLANNSASWQWVAGCGADAAPYFRIFNPATQGEKFDPDGTYTRRYVPELASLPDRYLFRPWDAPHDVLDEAGVTLGKDYPHPLVDLKASRREALDAFEGLSNSSKA